MRPVCTLPIPPTSGSLVLTRIDTSITHTGCAYEHAVLNIAPDVAPGLPLVVRVAATPIDRCKGGLVSRLLGCNSKEEVPRGQGRLGPTRQGPTRTIQGSLAALGSRHDLGRTNPDGTMGKHNY